MNKRKIINDPLYGFINIQSDIIFDLIEHPYFQRLRRIRQLGLTNFVYPGANHTRFQHAIGTIHLIDSAINVIRQKGHDITAEEAEALTITLLLHDMGHGPFSHALEHNIMSGINHEYLSELFMQELNKQFDNKLEMAIQIFNKQYHKKFLHELVASQLDMDRLDYLNRDSFFTGVIEGVVGADRILKMLNVVNDKLVIDAKGIYSIEKFLIARRIMYWQVYLHKTVVSAEHLLNKIFKRAKELAKQRIELFATPAFSFFLNNTITKANFEKDDKTKKEILSTFALIDDHDIIASIKVWTNHSDFILNTLCNNFINRNLYKTEIQDVPFSTEKINQLKEKVEKNFKISKEHSDYFVFSDSISNNAYDVYDEKIEILTKNNELTDVTEASDIFDSKIISRTIKKYFLCYPKKI